MKIKLLILVLIASTSFSLQNELNYLEEDSKRNLQTKVKLISSKPADLLTIETTILTVVKTAVTNIGKCTLNFGEIKDGFTKPDSKLELTSYDPDHREIRLFNCSFTKSTVPFLIKNNNYFSINFRNLSNKGKVEIDQILGGSLTYTYTDDSNQSFDVVFLYGNCKGRKTTTNGKESSNVNKQELDTLKGYFDNLSQRHKTVLRNEISKGIAKLKEYETFDKLNLSVQDSNSIKGQYSSLEDQISRKNVEYKQLQNELDGINKALNNENLNLESKKAEKRTVESEINSLNSRKTTLETQQIEDNKNINNPDAERNSVQNTVNSLQDVINNIQSFVPDAFNGCGACIENNTIKQCCIDRVNSL